MANDLEQRLREFSSRLDEEAERLHAAGSIPGIAVRRGSTARSRRFVSAGVAAVLVVGGVLAIAARPNDGTSTSAPLPATTDEPCGRWSSTPSTNLVRPRRAAVQFTGSEVIIFGGGVSHDSSSTLSAPDDQRVTAAAYSAATGEWRALSPGPLPGNDSMVSAYVAGTVVFGVQNNVLLYDVAKDLWRTVPLGRSGGEIVGVFAGTGSTVGVVSIAPIDAGFSVAARLLYIESGTWSLASMMPAETSEPVNVTASDKGAIVWTESLVTWQLTDDLVWSKVPPLDLPDGWAVSSAAIAHDSSTGSDNAVISAKSLIGDDGLFVSQLSATGWTLGDVIPDRSFPPSFPVMALNGRILSLAVPGGAGVVVDVISNRYVSCDVPPGVLASDRTMTSTDNAIFVWSPGGAAPTGYLAFEWEPG